MALVWHYGFLNLALFWHYENPRIMRLATGPGARRARSPTGRARPPLGRAQSPPGHARPLPGRAPPSLGRARPGLRTLSHTLFRPTRGRRTYSSIWGARVVQSSPEALAQVVYVGRAPQRVLQVLIRDCSGGACGLLSGQPERHLQRPAKYIRSTFRIIPKIIGKGALCETPEH